MSPEQLETRDLFIRAFRDWERTDTDWFEEGLWAECEANFAREYDSFTLEVGLHSQTGRIQIVIESEGGDLFLRSADEDAAHIAGVASDVGDWRDVIAHWTSVCALTVVDDDGVETPLEGEAGEQ